MIGPAAALLLALPASKAKYLERIHRSDFLRGYAGDPEFFWTLYEAEVTNPLNQLKSLAQKAGAQIFEDAGIQDLNLAMERFDVVVLLSHWKGPLVIQEDFLTADPQAFVSRVKALSKAGAKGAPRWLAKKFRWGSPKVLGKLRAILNGYIEQGELGNKSSDGLRLEAHPFTLETLRRDELDRIFSGLMRPGNRVEFADGLRSKEEVAAAVPHTFHGTFDITTCTSMVLSDCLDRSSRGAYRTVQFLAPQEPGLTCLLLGRVFELLREGGSSYLEARLQAQSDLKASAGKLFPHRRLPGLVAKFFGRLFMPRSEYS
jgi:hypothetical protein